MRVLVTGGTGMVGHAAVLALRAAGHVVRVVARREPDGCLSRIDDVEYVRGDVTDAAAMRRACEDCEAVVHAAGALRGDGRQTLDALNITGTRHVLDAAMRAGARRFVFLSSLGAERGESDYHRTKRVAELLVRQGAHEWVILRPGNVYGPGESHIARFVRAMRTWPVVPIPVAASLAFQPIWLDDLAQCIRAAVTEPSLARRTFELAGPDVITQGELYERVAALVERRPPLVATPAPLIALGAPLLDAIGIGAPITRDEVTMIRERNVARERGADTMARHFGVTPTGIEAGLRRLVRATPEQLPGSGVGAVTERRYWARIEGAPVDAAALLQRVTEQFRQLMPSEAASVGAEPTSQAALHVGATVAIGLPLRGHVQVRVEECTAQAVTCATLDGHPLAGMVRFCARQRHGAIEFEVRTVDQPGTWLDRIALGAGGMRLKAWTWRRFVRDVVRASGGRAPAGVQHAQMPLSDDDTRAIRSWLERLAAARRREHPDLASATPQPQR